MASKKTTEKVERCIEIIMGQLKEGESRKVIDIYKESPELQEIFGYMLYLNVLGVLKKQGAIVYNRDDVTITLK